MPYLRPTNQAHEMNNSYTKEAEQNKPKGVINVNIFIT